MKTIYILTILFLITAFFKTINEAKLEPVNKKELPVVMFSQAYKAHF